MTTVVSFLFFNWSVPTVYVECTNQNVLKWPINNSWLQWFLYQLLWVQIPLRRGVLDTTLCDQVCQLLAAGLWFSPGNPVSSANKTDRHNILVTEILYKVALTTINIAQNSYLKMFYGRRERYDPLYEMHHCSSFSLVWTPKASLSPPLFIKVLVQSQKVSSQAFVC